MRLAPSRAALYPCKAGAEVNKINPDGRKSYYGRFDFQSLCDYVPGIPMTGECRGVEDARWPARFRPPAFFVWRARAPPSEGLGWAAKKAEVDVREPERSSERRLRPAARPWCAERGRRA